MEGGALGLPLEKRFAASGRVRVEAAFQRGRSRYCKLVELQGAELRGDQVRSIEDVARPSSGGYGELSGCVQPRIEERAFVVHLEIRDERVPICDRTPACPGVEIDANQPKSGRNENGSGLSSQGCAILNSLEGGMVLRWNA